MPAALKLAVLIASSLVLRWFCGVILNECAFHLHIKGFSIFFVSSTWIFSFFLIR